MAGQRPKKRKGELEELLESEEGQGTKHREGLRWVLPEKTPQSFSRCSALIQKGKDPQVQDRRDKLRRFLRNQNKLCQFGVGFVVRKGPHYCFMLLSLLHRHR